MSWPESAPYANAVLRAAEKWAEAYETYTEDNTRTRLARLNLHRAVREYRETAAQHKPPVPKEAGD